MLGKARGGSSRKQVLPELPDPLLIKNKTEATIQVAMRADEPMDQGDMNGLAPVAPKSPPPA